MNRPPQGNDVLAMTIGALAPCVSAPWWEEVSKWIYEYCNLLWSINAITHTV